MFFQVSLFVEISYSALIVCIGFAYIKLPRLQIDADACKDAVFATV